MRLLAIAPRGWDRLPPLLASRVGYLAWVSERIPAPYPPNTVFQRWHERLDVAALVSAHKPDKVAVLAWGDAGRFAGAAAKAAASGVPVVAIETAVLRLPTGKPGVTTVNVGCFPSPTGDDPISRALAVGKLVLPESAAEIQVSCPSVEEVVGALLEHRPPRFEAESSRPLLEILEGVSVRLVPDNLPRTAAAALARVLGAVYWPPEVWMELQSGHGKTLTAEDAEVQR